MEARVLLELDSPDEYVAGIVYTAPDGGYTVASIDCNGVRQERYWPRQDAINRAYYMLNASWPYCATKATLQVAELICSQSTEVEWTLAALSISFPQGIEMCHFVLDYFGEGMCTLVALENM